jgi:ferredoxin
MSRLKVVLGFPPERVENPVIHNLITLYGLHVNILRASIDPGKHGRMVVEISGEEPRLSQGFNYLEGLGVDVGTLAEEIRHNEEKCMSCTACLPHCPTGAMEVDRQSCQVSFSSDKCVVCLSCVEACPYRAVETIENYGKQ